MALVVKITPDLEPKLIKQAQQQGLGADEYVVQVLREHLSHTPAGGPPHLSEEETQLLQQINQGLSATEWQRYNNLIAQRRAETLTPEEQTELIAFSDRLESLNAHRIELLGQLAHLRQVPLRELMHQLGIQTPAYV